MLIAVAVSALYLIRLQLSPDFTGDEALYAVAGRTVAEHGDIAWGTPVFVHPPGYFLLAGAWLTAFAPGGPDVLGDIHTLRYLNAILSCLAAALAGALAAALAAPRIRLVACCATTLLVAANPISIRFGRMVLIEPLALALGLAAVLLAWRLRESRSALYVPVVGLVGGLALLTKSVTVFIIVTPLVAAILAVVVGRRPEPGRTGRVRREVGALAVAGGVWLAFPIWAVSNGEGLPFLSEQTISIRRLLGLLQLSGLNRPGVSALDSLLGTLGQYAGAYLLLLAGGLGLLCALLRARPWNDRTVYLVSYCGLAFGSLGYNVVFGQANEQLFCYAFPAAAIAAVTVWEPSGVRTGWRLRPARYLRATATALLLAATAASGASWVQYQVLTDDDGTVATRDFLAAAVPLCAPVNGTGDQFRWGYVMRTHPVTAYASGPDAVADGVHVFILSSKDSQFLYGNSNPALDSWVRSAGVELFTVATHTYGELSVWRVGEVQSRGDPADGCAMPLPGAVTGAGMEPFLIALAAAVALLAAGTPLAMRRRATPPTTGGDPVTQTVPIQTVPTQIVVPTQSMVPTQIVVPTQSMVPTQTVVPTQNPAPRQAAAAAPPAGTKPARAAWLTAAMGLSAVANYGYTLLLTYGLAPADYAVFAAGHGVLLILGTFGAVAVPWVLAREIVLQAGHPDRQRAAVNLAFWINVGLGAVLAVAVAAVTLTFATPPTALVMAATTFLLAIGSTALGYLQGVQRVTLLGLVVLTEFVVKLVAGAVLVFVLNLGATASLFAATLGALIPLTACVTCLRAIGRPRRTTLSPGLWRAAGRIGSLQVVVAFFTALDTVLVAALAATRAQAGPYQAAATIGRTPLFVSVAVSTAVFPVLMAHRGDVRQRAEALRTLVIVCVFALVAMAAVPEAVVDAVFPAEFVPLVRWLPVVTLAGTGLGVLNLLTTFIQTEDRVAAAQRRLVAGFALHAFLLVAGAGMYGINGLAWGSVIGVWVTVVLLATLPSERSAVGGMARRTVSPPNLVGLALLSSLLVAVDHPVGWLACAAAGGLATCVAAFPELARLARPSR